MVNPAAAVAVADYLITKNDLATKCLDTLGNLITKLLDEANRKIDEIGKSEDGGAETESTKALKKYRESLVSLNEAVNPIEEYTKAEGPSQLQRLSEQIVSDPRGSEGVDVDRVEYMLGLSRSSEALQERYKALYDAESEYLEASGETDRFSQEVSLDKELDQVRLAFSDVYLGARNVRPEDFR